jgi:MFS family permease
MGTPENLTSVVRPTRVRYGVLGFACTLSLITYLDRVCIMRASEDIQNDLGFSIRQMGFVFSAFLVGYLLFEIPGGWMSDRWGSRRVLARIVLWWSAFTALTGCIWHFSFDTGRTLSLGGSTVPLIFDAFVLMLVVRFLFGAGEAGAYPTLTRVVCDWFPPLERASAQGLIWFSARLGGAVAPLVIGRLAVGLGWRPAFWILGVVGLVWAICFLLWFRSHPDKHPRCNEAERELIQGRHTTVTRGGHAWPGVGRLAACLSLWAMSFAAFWVCFGWYFYPTWQPLYLKEVHGFSAQSWEAEVLSGLPFLCGAFGALAGGRVSDLLVRRVGLRWGRSLVGLIGFTGAGLCVMGTGFATSALQAVVLLCLAFFINDLAIPVIWAACADIAGRFAGTVAALMNTVGGFGAILTPALIPYVLRWLPKEWAPDQRWRIVFAGLAGAWFLAAAAWLFIDASKRLPQEDPHTPQPPTETPSDPTPLVQEGIRLADDQVRR